MKLASACVLALCFAYACGDDGDSGRGNAREDGGSTGDGDGDDIGIVMLLDGGVDAGRIVVSCDGVSDGAGCGSMGGLICIDGECVTSMCGDGFTNLASEACEDGNDEPGDGCEPDCSFTCDADDDCDDGNACDGVDRCDPTEHVCVGGDVPDDEEPCTSATVEDGECRSQLCVPKGCGDEVTEGEEECDDGNPDSGDGCEPSCTFTCEEDADCYDGNVCTGVESCDVAMHTCIAGEALECEADDECYAGACHPEAGCQSELIDADGDGHAPDSLPCGDDCDDSRADVNPKQVELCDDIDQDCDGEPQPTEAPTWYVDCDADGYAEAGARGEKQCEEPAATECGGRWTTREPNAGDLATFDCNDGSAETYPKQMAWFVEGAKGSEFDYDCNREEEKHWTISDGDPGGLCLSLGIGGACNGGQGWTAKVVPACGDRAEYTSCGDSDDCGSRDCGCVRTTANRYQECH